MSKRLTKSIVSLIICLSIVCLLPARAFAWGSAGHRIVAKIAMWRLQQLRDGAHDPRAKRALERIKQIFDAHANITLAPADIEAAAVWPDKVRTNAHYSFSKNLHFTSIPVDFQPGQDRFDRAAQCARIPADPVVTEGDCSIGALEHFKNVLRTSHNKVARLEALSFVVHFVGDLHQPLHNSEDKSFPNDKNFNGGHGDRGANLRYVFYLDEAIFNSADPASCFQKKQVCTTFYPSGPAIKNLHSVWDDEMISTEMTTNSSRKTENAYAQSLEAALPSDPLAPEYAQMAAGDPAAWAEEAHDIAEREVYELPLSKQKKSPADNKVHKFFFVGRDYRDKNIKNVDLQLQRAGIRLAAFLMDALN
jgi:hypothetical protein